MKINDLLEGKSWYKDGVEMCSKECCGQPVSECKCGPDCPHCNCYEKNKTNTVKETTSAGAVASVATPVGGLISRQPKNPDGTAKNALDQDNILSNGKPKKKKSSRSN